MLRREFLRWAGAGALFAARPLRAAKRVGNGFLGFVPNLDPLFSYTLRVRSENFGCARHSGHLREALCRFQTAMEPIPF